jgi:hypothetical protein
MTGSGSTGSGSAWTFMPAPSVSGEDDEVVAVDDLPLVLRP